ncbi:MAG: ABC transporter substrate-binding protein [Bacteroidales bacterium]|nr:ABC transporter substrate-binding protein [Bacteroidales bacterium]
MRFARILTVLAASLSAAAAATAQEPFVFSPQWTAQAQFAGYYAALEMGFYHEEGLDVRIVHPFHFQTPEQTLISGECDAATIQLMQAMELVDSGTPLVNILQTSMNNATVIVSRRGNPLERRGARVGTWKAGFNQIAFCLDKAERLNYNWVRVAANVNLFVQGAIDATLAMSYNEYNLLLQAGAEITEENVYRFRDHGYNIQDDGVYMTLAAYRRHKDRAERFARASRRGWEWVADHPREALALVREYVSKNVVATNEVLQKLMLDEILDLQLDPDSGQRSFTLRPDMVRQASGMMLEAGLISRPVEYEELIPR